MVRFEYRAGSLRAVAGLLLGTLACSGCATTGTGPGLGVGDVERIHAVMQEYADAWLANDRERVMRTLAADATLLPHHGNPPVNGREAIEAFWWPSGPPATVTAFQVRQSEVGGSGELAYVVGTFRLGFDYLGTAHSSEGNFLALLRKEARGDWKITHRIWNDPLPNTD